MLAESNPKRQSSPADVPLYPIGTAARLLGVSVHTLRMYERKGLVLPHHAESTHRLYSERDIERVRCIRNAINVEKISIEGVRRVLSLIPCWAILQCPESERVQCPAYSGHSEPCWNLRKRSPFCQARSCRECLVYNEFAECRQIKQKVKELLSIHPVSA